MKILLIEDDEMLAEAVSQILSKNNYSVDVSHDGEYGLDCAMSGIYDLILLDVMLPILDGISVLRRIREEKIVTPVIMLTAKGELRDRVHGLDCGADDYVAKPFETEELLARMRAVVRRKGDYHNEGILNYSDFAFSPHTKEIEKNSQIMLLSTKESQLLELLIEYSPRSLSKERIIEKLWGYDVDATDNHVETHVSLLRKKLRQLGSTAAVRNVRGVGYLLSDCQ
jgi:two-component system response regulator ArlR